MMKRVPMPSTVAGGSFFFFQAEDGIRDLTVTGVQTCALPISAALGARHAHPEQQQIRSRLVAADEGVDAGARGSQLAMLELQLHELVRGFREVRSEERRVGKECRSRWSPYH